MVNIADASWNSKRSAYRTVLDGWLLSSVLTPTSSCTQRNDRSWDKERTPNGSFGCWGGVLWSDGAGNFSTIPTKFKKVKSVQHRPTERRGDFLPFSLSWKGLRRPCLYDRGNAFSEKLANPAASAILATSAKRTPILAGLPGQSKRLRCKPRRTNTPIWKYCSREVSLLHVTFT